MAKQTEYLNLDEVVPEIDVVVKLDGNEHKLQPVSVEDFVKNIQTLQKLGTGSLDPETEKGLMIGMLLQVLPSIGAERLGKLTMLQLHTLIDFTREHSGEKKIEKKVATDTVNPPTGE